MADGQRAAVRVAVGHRRPFQAARRRILGTRLEPVVRWALRRPTPPPPWWQIQNQRYDQQTHEVMRRVLEADSNCVDVGSFEGEFLSDMLEYAPDGSHHAFEPLPQLAADLRARFPTVSVHQLALGADSGKRKFSWCVDEPGWSGLQRDPWARDYPPRPRQKWIEVTAARLDDVLPEDLPIRFIKIDANGGEMDVFRGAGRTLSTWRPFIAFEHGEAATYYREAVGCVYQPLAEAGLNVSTLERWLAGEDPLSHEEFLHHCEHTDFFWLAHP